MGKYITVLEPITDTAVWSHTDDDISHFNLQVTYKTIEVPSDIYIEKFKGFDYNYGPPHPYGENIFLKFRWKGNQYISRLSMDEFHEISVYADQNKAVWCLIKDFVEELKAEHPECLLHFVREVAKISEEFDVKKLMWLVDHDGAGGPHDIYANMLQELNKPIPPGGFKAKGGIVNNSEYYNNYSSPILDLHTHPAKQMTALEVEVSKKSKQLPGMDTVVDLPCSCEYLCDHRTGKPTPSTAWRVVQHLNDRHKWSREKIADWLDELHDSGKINIEFDTPEGMKDE